MMNRYLYILLLLFSFGLIFAVDQSNQIPQPDTINCTNCYEPIADSGDSKTYYKNGFVTLDGTASYDPEGQDLTYLWTVPEGIVLDDNTSSMPQFTAPYVLLDTDYVIELIVNDGGFNSDPDFVTISVVVINTEPVIESVDQLTVNKNAIFTIDASGSYDNTLTGTLSFQFTTSDFTTEQGLNNSVVEFTAPDVISDTDYNILLEISDGIDTSSKYIQIFVIANIKPYAIPGDDIQVSAGTDFTLDGSLSYDPDTSGELSYLWSWDESCGFQNESGIVNESSITLTASQAQGECDIFLSVNDSIEDSNTANGDQLFISEYIESGSDGISCTQDKLIEIYNPTSSSMDLSNYEVWYISSTGEWAEKKLLFNKTVSSVDHGLDQIGESGADIFNSDDLDCSDMTGDTCNITTIASGETLIIVKSESFLNCVDVDVEHWIEFGSLGHSGDDAIGLYSDGVGVIDAVGDENYPGSGGWEVAGVSGGTKNIQLIRKSSLSSGNSSWLSAAGTTVDDSEWFVYDEDSDISRTGSHYCAICDNFLTVTVTENNSPTADAGDNFTAVSNYEITIDGSKSTDSDTQFENLSFIWTSDDVIISNPTSAVAFFTTPEVAGTILVDLSVSDGPNTSNDTIEIEVVLVNGAPTTSMTVEGQYSDLNFDGVEEFYPYSGEAYESYNIHFDATGSFDDTSTGQLIYDWVAPVGFALNDSTSASPSFAVPEYLGADQTITFTLNLSDGDLQSSSVINVNLIARMPIISSNQTQYSSDESEIIILDASLSNDPDQVDLSNLEFSWNAPSGAQALGVCYDIVLNDFLNPLTSCDNQNLCIGATEICEEDGPYSFAAIPASIGEDKDYVFTVQAEDNDDFESEELEITISVTAKDPIANAGSNFSVVAGTNVTLLGYLSEDPQEQIVTYEYWDDDDFEDSEINFIAFYENSQLNPLEGYIFYWEEVTSSEIILSDNSSINPTFIAPESGTYEFSLTVTDPNGRVSSDEVSVTIIANTAPVSNAGEDGRVLSESLYILDGRSSFDETLTGALTYQWSELNSEVDIDNSTSSLATFVAPQVSFGEEDILNFELYVSDGELSHTDNIQVIIANYSRPISPNLYGVADHKKITLYWDNAAEYAIDSLTQYSDFQGYRIYKSQDYSQTWGPIDSLVFNNDGDTLGWRAHKIYDLSEKSDTSLCIYKYDFLDCEKTRGSEIKGSDPYQSWYSLGNNSGLSQTFVDTNVVDGIDYVYTITAYDRGIRPDTLEFGSYGDGDEDFGQDDETWYAGIPDHIFNNNIEVNDYNEKKLSYQIDSSYVDSLTLEHMYAVITPDGFNSGDAVWSLKRNFPKTNPDGYGMYSSIYEEYIGNKAFESLKGTSVSDNNYIQISPGKYASDVSFPEAEDLDEFISADCKAIGNGDKFYEVVNIADLTSGLVKVEIQADKGVNSFEGDAMEDACIYAYPVMKIEEENKPNDYLPIDIDTSELIVTQDLIYDNALSEWYYQEVGDLQDIKDLPGVLVNEDSNPATIIIPDYLLECHSLAYIDDPNYQNNWSDFFNGIRMRFDNALRLLPTTKAAELAEVYSYPDSALVSGILLSPYIDGTLELQYYGNTEFQKKPNYEYEIEFFKESYPDTATAVAPDNCGSSFKTLLPFRVKNLTTGKYVKVQHSDKGIWGGITTQVPSWFSTPDDIPSHPGYGDCVWQPGEIIQFTGDSVLVGESEIFTAERTFALNLYYDPEVVNYIDYDFCPQVGGGASSYNDFSTTSDYSGSECVYHEGMIWYATEDVDSQQIGVEEQILDDGSILEIPLYYEPNFWDDSNGDGINNNPWVPVYSWRDQTKIVLKPQKWFVDGDYWIADMSILGREEIITEVMLESIRVVPNPYIVSSAFQEDVNGNRLKFTPLPNNCKITIYSITGEVVDIINHSGSGTAWWDLKNQKGKVIAPGLYIFRVETDNELDFIGKFAIVR